MIQRLSDKQKPCTYCTQYGHTAFKCPRRPRKAMQTRNTLKTTTRLKPVGKQGKRTAAAVAKWKRNYKGPMQCHYCHRPIETLIAEHMESKVRRPDLRTDPNNFVPTCSPCNEKKLSKSHDEVPHNCNLVK